MAPRTIQARVGYQALAVAMSAGRLTSPESVAEPAAEYRGAMGCEVCALVLETEMAGEGVVVDSTRGGGSFRREAQGWHEV